jgi:uncharacterized protein YecE (DUF72 family)
MKSKAELPNAVRVGCAGWALRKEHASEFQAEGTHLTRYAGRFPAVEINSSFYKPHKPATYVKWGASVHEDFRFAVKVPKEATHARRLVGAGDVLDRFLPEATSLGARLGPLLVQLPPSLAFDADVAESFLAALRERFDGAVVIEPRHATWFESKAERLVTGYRVARVAADPAVVEEAAEPGGWDGLVYYRLHGSPKVYHSVYPEEYLRALAATLRKASTVAPTWCIFDNTAEGAATADALTVLERLDPNRADHE